MTDDERKDVSLAAMCGKTIQLYAGSFGWHEWDKTTPLCEVHQPIRIKPSPVVGEVVLHGVKGVAWSSLTVDNATEKMTIPTIDGQLITGEFVGPDGHVIKVEANND